jgi:hypothetical protein
MLCFLLLRLGSMSASSGRGRQHAFLKQKVQRTIRGASRPGVLNATLFAALHNVRFWHIADIRSGADIRRHDSNARFAPENGLEQT